MTPDRVQFRLNGTAPQARVATTIQADQLDRAPIVCRRPGPAVHVHDVDVTAPTDNPDLLTWDDWHDSYGMVIDTDDPLIERCRFTTLGDGVSIQGRRAVVDACWFDDIYDDAIQLDHKWPATISGCVLDGVHIGFSSESKVARTTYQAGTVVIRDTYVRLRPQHHSYDPERWGHGQHGPFFKWQKDSPHVHLDGVWLAAWQPASYFRTLGPPPSVSGSVTLVGTDRWPERDVDAWFDSGVDLHLADEAQLDARLAALRYAHPAAPEPDHG